MWIWEIKVSMKDGRERKMGEITEKSRMGKYLDDMIEKGCDGGDDARRDDEDETGG